MMPPEIFSRTARRLVHDRCIGSDPADRWLLNRMADELVARLDAVKRPFARALVIGDGAQRLATSLRTKGIETYCANPGFRAASLAHGTLCDEDRLPFADSSFDLVMANGTLDTVHDLPGALVLIRRVLRPDCLFLGAMMGANSLPTLRATLAAATNEGANVARMHPAVDVRAAGDLLTRAGFVLPVAESEAVEVDYRSAQRLFADLRANGLSNVLRERESLDRATYLRLATLLSATPLQERFNLLFLTGWTASAQ